MRHRRTADLQLRSLILLPLLGLLIAAGCGRSGGREADRQEIESLLAAYADALTRAYETGDPAVMAEVATQREQVRVQARIEELAVEGRALRPRLLSQTLQEIDFGNASATAVAVEAWHLRVVAAGSELTVSELARQENTIVYSVSRDEGRWRVLARILRSSSDAEAP